MQHRKRTDDRGAVSGQAGTSRLQNFVLKKGLLHREQTLCSSPLWYVGTQSFFSAVRAKKLARTAPEMLCHTENTAPGIVASGYCAKWAAAREVARPEFCMYLPTKSLTFFQCFHDNTPFLNTYFCGCKGNETSGKWLSRKQKRLCPLRFVRDKGV